MDEKTTKHEVLTTTLPDLAVVSYSYPKHSFFTTEMCYEDYLVNLKTLFK